MMTIYQSVGKSGSNLTKDVRVIQVMLYETRTISKNDFIKECIDQTIIDPTNEVKDAILNAPAARVSEILEITEGTQKIKENLLSETIIGIFKFQKDVLGYRNPDGRVDPNGFTLRKLNEQYQKSLKSKNINVKSHSVAIEGDRITLKIQVANNVATRFFSAAKTRAFVLKNYNRNGAVKLMRRVFDLHNEKYFPPTRLTGTPSDDELIIPAEGVAHVLSAQLSAETALTPPSSSNLYDLLGRVDGLPGNGFISKILKEKSLLDFLSEMKNTSMIRLEDGTKLSPPATKESHEEFYQFLRDLTRSRNGLWSDEVGIVNLVGFRRVIDRSFKTAYNDTLAVCLREEDENGHIVPKVELYLGSTEAGNRKTDRQLISQTLDVVPGLHYYRQPAGRTRNGVKQERNGGKFTWSPGDTTMNFHQGANNFRYYGGSTSSRNSWLTKFGFNWEVKLGMANSKFDEKRLINLSATLSEIYLILSRYGGVGTKAPYGRLGWIARMQLAENLGLNNGKIKVRLGGKTKEIDTQKAKEWAVNYWFRKRSKTERGKFTDILKKLKTFDDDTVRSWESMSKDKIVQALTDEHILKVVERQIKYFSDLKDIDGLPGQGFLEIIAGISVSIKQAKEDKIKIEKLFTELKSFPLKNTSTLVKRLKESMLINTKKHRTKIHLNFKDDPRIKAPVVENTTVGAYSQGCQIIYDTEIFYSFWTTLMRRAQKSGQERWYYTLIDVTGWKNVDWT